MLAALVSMAMKRAPPTAAYPRASSTTATQPAADLDASRHSCSHPWWARPGGSDEGGGRGGGGGTDIVSQFIELRLLPGRTALL